MVWVWRVIFVAPAGSGTFFNVGGPDTERPEPWLLPYDSMLVSEMLLIDLRRIAGRVNGRVGEFSGRVAR